MATELSETSGCTLFQSVSAHDGTPASRLSYTTDAVMGLLKCVCAVTRARSLVRARVQVVVFVLLLLLALLLALRPLCWLCSSSRPGISELGGKFTPRSPRSLGVCT